jgi:acetyltransferase-like isoleucine patch superfamily enzyme
MAFSKRAVLVQKLLAADVRRNLLRAGITIGADVTFRGRPIVDRHPGSSITVADGVTVISDPRWTALGVARPTIIRTLTAHARVEIGRDSGLSGVTICSATSVSIGMRVLCGADVFIADTDFHPVDEIPRSGMPLPASNPSHSVTIEDDVFLGARTIVLKGVNIGHGSVIGAGSVVVTDIPPMSIAAGNPARVIRTVKTQ